MHSRVEMLKRVRGILKGLVNADIMSMQDMVKKLSNEDAKEVRSYAEYSLESMIRGNSRANTLSIFQLRRIKNTLDSILGQNNSLEKNGYQKLKGASKVGPKRSKLIEIWQQEKGDRGLPSSRKVLGIKSMGQAQETVKSTKESPYMLSSGSIKRGHVSRFNEARNSTRDNGPSKG